eukprot:sb/3466838/
MGLYNIRTTIPLTPSLPPDNKILNGSMEVEKVILTVSVQCWNLFDPNLSQIYNGTGDNMESYNGNCKTEPSPIRGSDFCNDENTFSQQQQPRDHITNCTQQNFESIYNTGHAITSSSSMQRQFSGGTAAYDTTSMLSNPVFSSQHQTYPTYPLPVKAEPSSPNSPYQLNPYYLGSASQTAGGGLYPSATMNLNQIDYQGYRSTAETDPVLSHPLFGGLTAIPTTVATPTDTSTPRNHSEIKLHEYQQSEVNGPMRIRRIKRPIPAGPTYPVHLWQFILELLGDHSCQDIISWTGNDLEFKEPGRYCVHPAAEDSSKFPAP